MKINFKNLGAVKDATIDLNNKLIVFCGPNNTGKTYISYAIYGIIEGLGNAILDSKLFTVQNFKELVEKKEIDISLNTKSVFKYNVLETLFEKNMSSIYGISDAEAKKIFEKAKVEFLTTYEEYDNILVESNFNIIRDLGFVKINFIKKENSDKLKLHLLSFNEKNIEPFFAAVISDKIFNILIRFPVFSSFIFPVERNSIYTFSKELSIKRNMLIDEIQKLTDSKYLNPFEWIKKRSTRYPLPIRHGLEISEDIVNYKKTETEFFEFATEIEDEILNGKLTINKDGDVLFASNKAKSKKLPIHLSASLVKTLSSIVFYLKHLAKSNDLIIIDEPELNLHPNNQIILTRIFAKLINRGFRIILSTHSDYIIREVNNLIMLSSVKNEEISKLGYSKSHIINKSDVAAYLFKYTSKSSTKTIVKKLEIKEDGFDVDSIDKTIQELNDRTSDLFQIILEQKND